MRRCAGQQLARSGAFVLLNFNLKGARLHLHACVCFAQYLVLAAETAPFLYEVEEDDDEVHSIVDAWPPHYISASDTFAPRPLKRLRRELSRIWRPCSGKACRITPHEEGSLAYLPSKHIVAQRTRATQRNARSSSKLDFSLRIRQAAQRRICAARGGVMWV